MPFSYSEKGNVLFLLVIFFSSYNDIVNDRDEVISVRMLIKDMALRLECTMVQMCIINREPFIFWLKENILEMSDYQYGNNRINLTKVTLHKRNYEILLKL